MLQWLQRRVWQPNSILERLRPSPQANVEQLDKLDLANKTLRANSRRSTRRRRQREFFVIGLGRFGSSLARALVDMGHDVLAADIDYHLVQVYSSDLPHVVQLDATNFEAMREVGAEHFDTGIACMATDFESNLLATVLLRKLGVPHVIVKARTRTQREILLQVGADEVILPEQEAGVRLARRLSTVDFVDYLELSPDEGIVELLAPPHLHGLTLAEVDLRQSYGLTVLAIRRPDQSLVNPPADARIESGDELLVMGKIVDAQRMCQ
ncbi:MAG: potassium channel family protein [Anaerolineae bacterium]